MSASEIKSFEDFWKYLWSIIYSILEFFRGAGKEPVDVGSNTVRYDSIKPVVY
ncbi:MAG: hypothetical protein SPI93_00980 [Oscillospiraceae bacterium]|nr:hypothetical protein [Oscillospiraceae bacterium]